ncbi:MAG: hypothetical protein M3N56_07575, partial [Actinomycetota bacterium]|nr:hypothetical protein [Actinomycetota bacterium]
MTYSPHTEADRARMLDAVGVASVDDLFEDIPAAVRAGPWNVPPPLVEQEVRAELARLAGRNRIPEVSFLGAGVYRHLIPSVVGEVIGRPEFATAYTPYQPEVSQGTLQSIYEFQSLICELTGMEVATASHYDGATATAEAALMACRLTRRSRVAVSMGVNPDYRRVLETYCSGPGIEVVSVPVDLAENGSGATATAEAALMACRLTRRHRIAISAGVSPDYRRVLETYCSGPGVEVITVPIDLAEGGSGTTDPGAVTDALADDVACLVAAQPNFYGQLEPMGALA